MKTRHRKKRREGRWAQPAAPARGSPPGAGGQGADMRGGRWKSGPSDRIPPNRLQRAFYPAAHPVSRRRRRLIYTLFTTQIVGTAINIWKLEHHLPTIGWHCPYANGSAMAIQRWKLHCKIYVETNNTTPLSLPPLKGGSESVIGQLTIQSEGLMNTVRRAGGRILKAQRGGLQRGS